MSSARVSCFVHHYFFTVIYFRIKYHSFSQNAHLIHKKKARNDTICISVENHQIMQHFKVYDPIDSYDLFVSQFVIK